MKDKRHIKRFNEAQENLNISDVSDSKDSLDINNKSDVDRIMKLIEDQSMEWAYGQGTQPGEEREMVSQSFIEGARLVISLLQGDEDLMDMFKDIK
jgi:hypothetical protein